MPGGGGMPPYGMPGAAAFGMQPMPVQMPQYPQGGGPLGEASFRIGANGLYEAPEPEGPEPHGKSRMARSVLSSRCT